MLNETTVQLNTLCDDVIDCPHSTPIWRDEGVLVVRNYNIVDGCLNFDNASYVDEETYIERVRRGKPEPGDLIISREAPMGAVCMVPEGVRCCLGQRLVLLKVNKKICDPHYLLFALQSKFVQSQIKAIDKTGSIVSNLNIPDLKALMIPNIEKPTQESIGAILSAIVKKITLNKTINAELEKTAKLLYDYWFVQYDFPNAEGKPYKSSGGAMVWNEQFKREIPQGWESTELSKTCKFISGFPFSSDDYVNTGKYRVITIKNVQDNGVNLDVDNFLNKLPERLPDDCILKVGDILMSLTGNVGRVGLMYANDCLLNQRVALVKPTSGDFHGVSYLTAKGDHVQGMMQKMASGSSQANLSPVDTGNIKIEFNTDVAVAFSKQVKPIIEKILGCLQQNMELTALRDFLLPLLMNGQVTVKIGEKGCSCG
jgi:type I restriction enzyme S subunit